MTLFTNKFHEFYEREIDGYKKYIKLQEGIIAQKEQEVAELKLAVQVREAENIQLRDLLRAAHENQSEKDKTLEPIFTRNEPWTIKRQRLEREDRQSPEVVAQRMALEAHWKKRNEEINAREKGNA